MIIEGFLPERSAQDILAGRIRVTLGGEEFVLPSLTIAANDEWRERCSSELRTLFGAFESIESPVGLLAWLDGTTDLQLRLLRAYDVGGVLPDDEWLRSHASPDAVLRAVLEVTAAAFPTFAVVLDMIVRNPSMIRTLIEAGGSSRPTSGRRPSTGGAHGTSGNG